MSARDDILGRVRRHAPSPLPRPHFPGPWIRYENLRDQFCESLDAVGGRALVARAWSDVMPALAQIPQFANGSKRLCAVNELSDHSAWTEHWSRFERPHDLAALDWLCAPGKLGVAENGAIWVTDDAVPIRSALFLTEHLILVIPAARVVSTLHDAYAELDVGQDRGFGCFISGPSKTADIEQSLVIGAQGARSLTAVLVEQY